MQRTNAQFREALQTALQAALTHLEGLDHTSVAATVDRATLRKRLGKQFTNEGLPPEQVVAELVEDVEGGILGFAGGRFFGWVAGGSLPAALAADWLTATWDQNSVLYASGPAAAVVEEVAGGWLKEILGLTARADARWRI
jgi:glutamate/tyrosine decarboxylase-like PLP-dependent enzyme